MVKWVLFQLHWFFGITAGIVLAVVGVTGGMLSFEREILVALNPGILTVGKAETPPLAPDALIQRIRAQAPDKTVTSLTVYGDPERSARVMFAPPPGERRGEFLYVNPYDGKLLPRPRGEDAMFTIMFIHRWLAAGEVGKQIVGASTAILIFFALSGLYLRWPRNWASLKTWVYIDFSRRGRSLFWELHSIVGTWVLPFYLLAALTGLTWSYDWYRNAYYDVLGAPRPAQRGPGGAPPQQAQGQQGQGQQAANGAQGAPPQAGQTGTPPAGEAGARGQNGQPGGERGQRGPGGAGGQGGQGGGRADLATLWPVFVKESGGFTQASLRLPVQGASLSIQYIPLNADHERASNTLVLDASGKVREHKRYADLPLNLKLAGSIFPLHAGSFFGMPGLILMMIASLLMPLFTITGWLLYLDRRRKKKEVARQAAALSDGIASDAAPVLIAFASQSGTAERLAWQSAGLLKAAGRPVRVTPLGTLRPQDLVAAQQVLFVVSTFGEGEAPDSARPFAKLMQAGPAALTGITYGVLALGERSYAHFCGFGRDLDAWLHTSGATPLFDRVEADHEDAAALRHWQAELGALTGTSVEADWTAPAYRSWRLVSRRELNPGSVGLPTFHVVLEPADGTDLDWSAGDVAEVGPENAPATLDAFFAAWEKAAPAELAVAESHGELRQVLARRHLPAPAEAAGWQPQDFTERLKPLPHREYSIASIPQDGRLELVVRQARTPEGYGLGSGWLTVYAPIGGTVALRIRPNSGFHAPPEGRPLILIGNGTGLAGLRSLLKARIHAGQDRNWLIFGERNADKDFYFREELAGWTASGALERLDTAFSRDAERLYVQDVLKREADRVKAWVAEGAAIYVCGSLKGMAPAVHQALTDILGADSLEAIAQDGRYRRDVY